MDGCRLNMSHCSHDLGRRLVGLVRQISREAGREIPIGADLRGPKLRIGDVIGGEVTLADGQILWLTPNPAPTDARTASVEYPFLAEDLRPGDPVLMNDGLLVLRVEELRPPEVACLCRQAGKRSIVGGQLLASMASSPIPLRSEVADLAAVVTDGFDAVILSDETASGDYPVEAVRTAAQVMDTAEQMLASLRKSPSDGQLS